MGDGQWEREREWCDMIWPDFLIQKTLAPCHIFSLIMSVCSWVTLLWMLCFLSSNTPGPANPLIKTHSLRRHGRVRERKPENMKSDCCCRLVNFILFSYSTGETGVPMLFWSSANEVVRTASIETHGKKITKTHTAAKVHEIAKEADFDLFVHARCVRASDVDDGYTLCWRVMQCPRA